MRVTTFDSEGKPGIVRYFLAYEGVLSLQISGMVSYLWLHPIRTWINS